MTDGWTVITRNSEETKQFAERLSQLLQAGDVLTLTGDLGAGKTTFTQGLAAGLGIQERVNSPTFTIIKEYVGRLPLYHMDVYRLAGQEEMGLEEYFNGDGVTVVEWPSMIEDQLPRELLSIEMESISANERSIRLTPYGGRYMQLCKEIQNEYTRN